MHCIASTPAMRSTVHSRSAAEAARNCAVPLLPSQNRKVSGWFESLRFSNGGNLATACTFFTMAFPLACPGLHSAKLDLNLTPSSCSLRAAHESSVGTARSHETFTQFGEGLYSYYSKHLMWRAGSSGICHATADKDINGSN